jgi:hypothetical protein
MPPRFPWHLDIVQVINTKESQVKQEQEHLGSAMRGTMGETEMKKYKNITDVKRRRGKYIGCEEELKPTATIKRH